jgi:enterobactin synthetase component D
VLDVALRLDLPHGHVVALSIPDSLPSTALDILLPGERALAQAMAPARQRTFVAGRLALRTALQDLGLPDGPLLTTDRGAPALAAGASGSISHKRTLAVALAAPARRGLQLGVDVEEDAPLRVDVSRRVLTSEEAAALAAGPPEARERAVLLRLSAKEAIYKALDPFVRRHVSFKEAALVVRDDGTAEVGLTLTGGEGPFVAEVCWREIWAGGPFFLTTAAIRPV